MFCGTELSYEFSQEIRALNLDVFHIRNFRYHTDFARPEFFHYCYYLKTLYVVHPDVKEKVYLPKKLKKLVIYCPKSSKDVIDKCGAFNPGLWISVDKCHALKEM